MPYKTAGPSNFLGSPCEMKWNLANICLIDENSTNIFKKTQKFCACIYQSMHCAIKFSRIFLSFEQQSRNLFSRFNPLCKGYSKREVINPHGLVKFMNVSTHNSFGDHIWAEFVEYFWISINHSQRARRRGRGTGQGAVPGPPAAETAAGGQWVRLGRLWRPVGPSPRPVGHWDHLMRVDAIPSTVRKAKWCRQGRDVLLTNPQRMFKGLICTILKSGNQDFPNRVYFTKD